MEKAILALAVILQPGLPSTETRLGPRVRSLTAKRLMINLRQAQMKLAPIVVALAMVAGTAAGARAATATWDRNTEPDIAGYRLSYGTQPGVHTVVLDVGNVITYQFNPPPGRYYVVVQAYNTAGDLSGKSAEVIVDIPVTAIPPGGGAPPSGGAPPVGVSPGGPPVAGPAPTVPLPPAAGPPGAVFPPVGAPPVGGLPPTGTPSTNPFPTANVAPSLVQPFNQKTEVNGTVSLALAASDPEGQPLKFTATGLPQGLSIDSASGRISGKANTKGAYQVTVTVSDGDFSSSRSFSWTVATVNAQTAFRAAAMAAAAAENDREAAQKATASPEATEARPTGRPCRIT